MPAVDVVGQENVAARDIDQYSPRDKTAPVTSSYGCHRNLDTVGM